MAAAVTDMQAELHLIGKKVSCMEGRQAARQLGSNFINPIGSEEFSSKIITLISLLSMRGKPTNGRLILNCFLTGIN